MGWCTRNGWSFHSPIVNVVAVAFSMFMGSPAIADPADQPVQCTFLATSAEDWVRAAEAIGGTATREGRSYSVSFEGEGYNSFIVSASACAHMGITIEIKDLQRASRESTLQMATNILRAVDNTFFTKLAPTLMLLGEDITTLETDGPFFMMLTARASDTFADPIDIRIAFTMG